MRRVTRTIFLIIVDAITINIALFLALWLRFDGVIKPVYLHDALRLAPWATCFYIAAFYFFRLYNRLWQYASIGELVAIVTATLAGSMASISLAYFRMSGGTFPLPRSIFALWTLLIIALVGFSRLSWRFFREYRFPAARHSGRAVLIVGAGDAGAMVAREYRNRNGSNSNGNGNGGGASPIGFVDDDPAKQGRSLLGLPVLGMRADIPRLVEELNIGEIVIAMPSVHGSVIREIVEICHGTGAALRIVPGIYDLLDGTVKVDPIREVRIEDILGREPV
jgi:FlaA1/EpsC-like NDP-sugar epimerase